MSDRDLIEAQRQAFKVGAKVRWNKGYRYSDAELDKEAAKLFPIPTLIRPRMIRIVNQNPKSNGLRPHVYFKIEGELLWWCMPIVGNEPQIWSAGYNETPENLRAKLALWKDPTIEVEIP